MKIKKSVLSLTVFLLSIVIISSTAFGDTEKINDWPLMKEAIAAEESMTYDEAISYWEQLVTLYSQYDTAYAFENGGHYAMRSGKYYSGEFDKDVFDAEKATTYFQIAYNNYLNLSEVSGITDYNWAFVDAKRRLDAIKTEAKLYIKTDATKGSSDVVNRTLSKFEPQSGMYLGIYAEANAALLSDFAVSTSRITEVYGKNHASILYYNNYGISLFPSAAAARMKAVDGSLQIHMQPHDLDAVSDSEYLRTFAKAAKASGIPIFLRFGGEMNGDWVDWGLQPEKYIEKFKLVHDVMAEYAPNVAMVFAPNFFPWDNIEAYYPGDAYVDWVGVSLYTTLDYTSETKDTKLDVNPIDLLEPIVDAYGTKKPIMIVEGAVSNYSVTEPELDYSDWAINNLRRFYAYIPMVYPEVKGIYYYDAAGVAGERESYSLMAFDQLKDTYKDLITSDYLLSNMSDESPFVYDEVKTTNDATTTGETTSTIDRGQVTFSAYIKSYEPIIAKVNYYVNGTFAASVTTLPFEFNYDFSDFEDEAVVLTLKAFLTDGTMVLSKDYTLSFTTPIESDHQLENETTTTTVDNSSEETSDVYDTSQNEKDEEPSVDTVTSSSRH